MLLSVDRFRGLALAAVVMCVVTGAPAASAQIVFSPPAALNTNAGTDTGIDMEPWITADGAGTWIAVWESLEPDIGAGIGDDRDILFSRSADNGATWSAPAALNTDAATDGSMQNDMRPCMATDGAGCWIAVWYGVEGDYTLYDYNILMARSADNGATWSAPAFLNSNANGTWDKNDMEPSVATDGAGTWVVAWQSNTAYIGTSIGSDSDILFSRSTDNGATWSAVNILNGNAASDTGLDVWVEMATDGTGNWVAVWRSTEANIGTGIGTDADILVCHSTDNGATWSAPQALNSYAATDGYLLDDLPEIAVDGAGNWIAVWDSIGTDGGSDNDVYFSRSTDGGATWSAAAALNTDAGTDDETDFLAQVTSDKAGRWAAVWSKGSPVPDGEQPEERDIVIARSTDGGATWTDPVALNTNADTDTGDDVEPRIATDGAGHWVGLWLSNEADIGTGIGTDADILVSRFTWPAPTVTSIAAADANPTGAASVDYTVTFNIAVTGVDVADFALSTDGLTGAAVSSVTPVSGSVYTVAVSTGSGDGTLRLDLVDDDSIADLDGLPLGGTGAGTGNHAGDDTYTVVKSPVAAIIGAPSATSTASGPVSYPVMYFGADTVTLNPADVTLHCTDTAAGSVTVTGSGTNTRTVTVSGITGSGEISVSIAAGTASDASHQAPAAGPSAAFTVTGGGMGVTYSSTAPVAIPDTDTITSTIVVPAFGAVAGITDVNVGLDISHTYDAGLEAYLTSPEGTTVALFSGVGGDGDDFTDTVLDDSSSVFIWGGSAPFTGTYHPEGNLADFMGESSVGTWTLTVVDTAAGDTGTLNEWRLEVTGVGATAMPVGRAVGLALAAALAMTGGVVLRRSRRRRRVADA